MDKQDGKVYDVDFSKKSNAERQLEDNNNMKTNHATRDSSLDFNFNYEVDTMFNKSDAPQSKSDFLASQDEGNEMYPYTEAFTYDPQLERYFSESTDAYFQDCQRKIKEAEEQKGGKQ